MTVPVPVPWYERTEETHASGRVYIRLYCFDCGTELRLARGEAGEAKAADLIRVHKPSGCCADKAAARAA